LTVKVWLDDVREAPVGWTWYKTAESLLADLQTIWPDLQIISLDHDLGDGRATGYDVAKRIEEIIVTEDPAYILCGSRRPLHFDIVVHSANPVGRKNMAAAITVCTQINELVCEAPLSRTPHALRTGWQW
jgi:hypothetical protein